MHKIPKPIEMRIFFFLYIHVIYYSKDLLLIYRNIPFIINYSFQFLNNKKMFFNKKDVLKYSICGLFCG